MDIVIPSLPGFVYSLGSYDEGFDLVAVSEILRILMEKVLDFKGGYLVHGGDWGATITQIMATTTDFEDWKGPEV